MTSPVQHLIIGGAEKAGSTSLYAYLSSHPDVRSSRHKETDFFRRETGDLEAYRSLFHESDTLDRRVYMESSPGYLGEADIVAPRIASVIPDARLVFIVRDPIDRLVSCYRFYQSRLHLPRDMSFGSFVDTCLDFEAGRYNSSAQGILPWHLNALSRGRYEIHISTFRRFLPESQILLLGFNELAQSPARSMQKVCAFAEMSSGFYDSYAFNKENVTFYGSNRRLHRIAITVNDRLETFWRRHPHLKQRLLRTYKRLNSAKPPAVTPAPTTLARLKEYYTSTYAFLEQELRQAQSAIDTKIPTEEPSDD